MVRYRDPWTEEIIDDREMQRRLHADEVIRREFDPEHGLPFPTVRGLAPGRHLVRLVLPRGERGRPLATVGVHGDSDTKF